MDGREVEILLVEDNPVDVELTLRAFAKNHLANHVQVARDGEEALTYLHDLSNGSGSPRPLPHVVLLDLKLPKIDGLEVLRQIRADARLRKLPVVVLTTSREERDIVDSYELGVNSYIVKPVSFDQFLDIVNQLGFYWLVLNHAPH